ncbi:MAG: SMP-30/gluconolactonase/LRE family protein [Gemmatimonadaceae bacterium]
MQTGHTTDDGTAEPSTRTTLTHVATFEHQVTGVSVAEDGRIFVNFPRWTEDAPVSVAELMQDGSMRPYPDGEWNRWRNAKKSEISPGDHWVCVQSVVADGRGGLWVLDPAAPATAAIVPGGPKLVRIELATNRVAQTIAFDTTVAPNGSYLNDVRFSPDGRHAYITDSGGQGALVVVDLRSGAARRVLDADRSVQPEKEVVVAIDGKPVRRPDGRGVEFASDGIALSRDGQYLYWKAVTGRTLYRITTAALTNAALAPNELAAKVERVGDAVVSDGLWMDAGGRLYLTAPEDHSVKVREPDGGDRLTTVVQDARLNWPDTLSQGPDGTMYVTASHIPDMSWYEPESPPQLRGTALFSFAPAR